ncbi:MAG: DUF4342 domain-containing protein [Candidatus Shapirobacteria bacterium]|jgi:hypothetical protein
MPTKTKAKTSTPKSAPKTETFKVEGRELVKKVKELIAEGNVRKISIINKNGKNLLNIPLNLGIIGAILSPPLIVVGALAAILTECTIKVERD